MFVSSAALIVEILSPDDESWQKLPFYAASGVDEVVIADPRDQSVNWMERHADAGEELTVERPSRFEHHRYVGDKRTQLVYDVDEWEDPAVVEDFVDLGVGIGFAPDTLAEARNRGYDLATPGTRRARS